MQDGDEAEEYLWKKYNEHWCAAAVAHNDSRGLLFRYGEPGVCMDFEETEEKLRANIASLGFDLRELAKRKKLLVDYVSVERDQIAETGEYNLEGLFIRSRRGRLRRTKRAALCPLQPDATRS